MHDEITADDLGSTVRDRITGYEGTMVGFCEHLYTESTVGIAQPVTPDGKLPASEWFAVGRCELVRGMPSAG